DGHLHPHERRPVQLDAGADDLGLPDRDPVRLARRRRGRVALPAAGARVRGDRHARVRAQGRGLVVARAWRERAFVYGVVVPFAFVLAVPFVWMVFTAFKSQAGVFNLSRSPFSLHGDTLAGWGFLLHQTPYVRWLGNTALVGGVVVAITLV